MVLMNVFAGKEWRRGCGEWTRGHRAGRRGWDELRKKHWHIYTMIYKTDS